MKYKVLETFKEIIGGDPVFLIHATIAPLFMGVPWRSGEEPIHTFAAVKGRDTYFALNEKRYFEEATNMFRRYYAGGVSLEDLKEKYSAYERNTRELYFKIMSTDISASSDRELRNFMHEINERYLELIQTVYIEAIDYDKILSVIGSRQKEKLDAIWERATEAAFVSFEGRYLRNMTDLVSSNEDNLIRKAKFMFTDYFWPKSDNEIEAALKSIRNDLDEKKREVALMYAEAQEKENKHAKWIGTLDADSKRIAEYMQLMMFFRDIRKDPIAQALAILADISTIMTQRAGIEVRHAPYIFLYEYMKGVEHLKSIRDEISSRERGCLYLASPDYAYEIEHCDFPDVEKQLQEWTKHPKHDADELKGHTACRGFVRGIVRVVSDPHDDRGFQDGDILVTSMTRPEFMPIMKRAGAVVTNEGGITCHAAIVSRELKKPCIIGTKIATQVLHDGDLVEVDADNGVVRVVERAK